MLKQRDKYFGALTEMRPEHAIDEKTLDAYLGTRVFGYRGPLGVKQFKGGLSNPTYLLTTPAHRYVLRRKPSGALEKSAHQVDREFRVLTALKGSSFPVPEPLHYCSDLEVIGSEFYVMRHVDGRIFLDITMPDLSREDRAKLYDSANQVLAKLHSLDYKKMGLEDFGRPGNYFSRQISRWSRAYQASRTDSLPEMDRLIEWLPTVVPEDDETCLIHGDYSFHNILVDPVEPRVVGVIDWELSTTGHPLGDLTYHAMEWYRPAASDRRGSLADIDLRALGIPDLQTYIGRYCERIGRPRPENLEFYQAYNLFRLSAIIQGVVVRGKNGTAAAADALDHAYRVPLLAKAAWKFAQRLGAA